MKKVEISFEPVLRFVTVYTTSNIFSNLQKYYSAMEEERFEGLNLMSQTVERR